METQTQTETGTTMRLPDGPRWWETPKPPETREWPGDYTDHAYDIKIEPLLREIRHDDQIVGTVTRNRYEAEVLNTPSMMILDIDVQDDHGRCTSQTLYRAMVRALDAGVDDVGVMMLVRDRLRALCTPEGEVARTVITTTAEEAAIGSHLLRGADDLLGRLYELEAVLADDYRAQLTGLGFRLYATRNGYRAICPTRRWSVPTEPDGNTLLWHFMGAAFTDDAYRRICFDQGLYRARLTPKPWRQETRVCLYLETVGSRVILPEFQPMIEEHDRMTGALTQRP